MEGREGILIKLGTGKVVIEPAYSYARWFKQGLAPVEKDEKWGYINKAGEVVVPHQFDDAEMIEDGMGWIAVDDLVGFIDVTGKVVIPPVYRCAHPFSEGLALVSRDGVKFEYINKAEKRVISLKEGRHGSPFSEGLAMVNDDWKYGFIDRTGKWVIKPVYERASDFNDGVSVVRFLS